MSKEIDWSKAPEGYPIWIEDLKPHIWSDMSGWHKEEEDRYVDEDGGFWNKPEDGFYRVYRNRNEPWTGIGLPPVGTVCEFCGGYPDPVEPWHAGLKDGAEVSIIAHYNNYGVEVAVFTFDDCRDCVSGFQVDQAVAGCFRPIRTKAQIEAEEREKAVSEMVNDCRPMMSRRAVCEDLYDAGYRKTEVGK